MLEGPQPCTIPCFNFHTTVEYLNRNVSIAQLLQHIANNVLARRASRRPMDGHFWGKYIQNSLNLLKNLQETCSLDGQLSISG